MILLAALTGVAMAAGALLLADGLTFRPRRTVARTGPRVPADVRRRAGLAVALGGLGLLLTRWPVAAVALAGLGWFVPDLSSGRAARERITARTEAVASWTEMLRDTMSGAHGLEEAIITTAEVAPQPIRAEAAALTVRVEREPLASALRAFADDLAHPSGDLVVTVLTLAAEGAVGDLNELLGTLALSAREEAAMQLRVDAARARVRTAVRVIAGVTAATALGLILLNRSYLDVYGSVVGQLVLAAVAAMWAGALWWLARMSRFLAPERFLASPPEEAA
jgi:tight adherence protein B